MCSPTRATDVGFELCLEQQLFQVIYGLSVCITVCLNVRKHSAPLLLDRITEEQQHSASTGIKTLPPFYAN